MLKSHGNTKSSTVSEAQSNIQRGVYRTQMKARRNLGKFLILWILLMKFNSYIHPFLNSPVLDSLYGYHTEPSQDATNSIYLLQFWKVDVSHQSSDLFGSEYQIHTLLVSKLLSALLTPITIPHLFFSSFLPLFFSVHPFFMCMYVLTVCM